MLNTAYILVQVVDNLTSDAISVWDVRNQRRYTAYVPAHEWPIGSVGAGILNEDKKAIVRMHTPLHGPHAADLLLPEKPRRPQRQCEMLKAFREHGYISLSLGDYIDNDLKALMIEGLVTSYPTVGAGRNAHLTEEGKQLMGVKTVTIP